MTIERIAELGTATRAGECARLRLLVAGAVVDHLERVMREEGTTIADLSARIKMSEARFDQILRSPGAWTFDIVSDLLAAAGARVLSLNIGQIPRREVL